MIIDAHTHLGSLGVAGGGREDPSAISVDYELRTEIMDKNGIDQCVVLPPTNYDKSEGLESTRRLNDTVRSIVDVHDRFIAGVATVEPTHGEAALGELERVADLGFPAVMWHHRFQGEAIDEPTTIELLKKTDALGLPTYIHCIPMSNLEALWRIENVAEYTDEPLIILDAFADFDNVPLAIELGNRFDHLYFDTALMFSLGRIVEKLVDGLGADRVVFGSDLYTQPLMFEHSSDLFQVRKADISEAEREAILGENIVSILELD